ncbi:type IV pilus assembly protein PilN [Oceanospirillum multiglobuliferum]|uniref:Pilus assembly protein PilN n=1 Tax=Oceanospirillum multiglobuliferum TaxID=64969 RepID=A0A1T4S351_9GAMM|nr:PilN domain-containing protein [Oceanospirillum multiglobuliferum]OPX54496.1 hypothetical protein BTE48_13930 [Oceanospirillum multiglobuliferum]SKA22577.1 type IV pilus assembly protein PilN [Oceanospirillum multiglobuliferum]
MPRINLLPWREEQRQQRQQQFIRILVLVVLVAVLLIAGVAQLIKQQQQTQQNRNNFIRLQIEQQNSEIKEVQALRKQRSTLLAWIDIVHQLQSDRSHIVSQLNLLARAAVDDLYFTSVQQTDGYLIIKGEAKNNRQISDLMRHLAHSELMKEPLLTDVSTSQINTGFSQFTLQISKAEPVQKETSAK